MLKKSFEDLQYSNHLKTANQFAVFYVMEKLYACMTFLETTQSVLTNLDPCFLVNILYTLENGDE